MRHQHVTVSCNLVPFFFYRRQQLKISYFVRRIVKELNIFLLLFFFSKFYLLKTRARNLFHFLN